MLSYYPETMTPEDVAEYEAIRIAEEKEILAMLHMGPLVDEPAEDDYFSVQGE